MGSIENSTIKAWLPSGIEIKLHSELPNDEHDEEEEGIGDAICHSIQSPNDDHDEEQSILDAMYQVIRLPEPQDYDEPEEEEEEEQGIGDAICHAIHELASALPTAKRFHEGKVIFDVPGRRIYLSGTVEVTRDDGFEKAMTA